MRKLASIPWAEAVESARMDRGTGTFLKVQLKEPQCQRLPADALDDQVVRWFFEALSAAEIDSSARVLAEGDRAPDFRE